MLIKGFLKTIIMFLPISVLAGCSVNPATGERQFTALMPASQEASIGQGEHPKILATYGGAAANQKLESYIRSIGNKLIPYTERQDVTYSFHLLDTPMVNAFAVPGGYIYITRGLVALADNEAELAGVMAHEIGHITARHSAERYSQSVLAGLGTMVLAAAVDNPNATKMAGLGSELYLKSYSRSQEHQADELGVRYLTRAGYDPYAMSSFLLKLQKHTELQNLINDTQSGGDVNYFATHPQTEERIAQASAHAAASHNGSPKIINRDAYLQQINGMIFGDSPRQGYVRGNIFIHPEMGFLFEAPQGYDIVNQPTQILVHSKNGPVSIFDTAKNTNKISPQNYIAQEWLTKENPQNLESITIGGKPAATATLSGVLKGQKATVRVMAISWDANTFFRFQMAYPENISAASLDDLKRMTYSLRPINAAEKQKYKPYKVSLQRAYSADSVHSLSQSQPLDKYNLEWFLLLNGLVKNEPLEVGKTYKVIK